MQRDYIAKMALDYCYCKLARRQANLKLANTQPFLMEKEDFANEKDAIRVDCMETDQEVARHHIGAFTIRDVYNMC